MTAPVGVYPTYAPPARRRSIAPWWVALIVLGIGATLAVAWFAFGGIPFGNHAAFGSVPVPGSGQLDLPAGAVVISFEEDGIVGEDDSADMPSDLQVVVTGPSGPVVVERVSENLFSVSVGSTGHVPYGRIELATAGTYQVAAYATEQTSAVAPRITFGEPSWNPLGPPIIGALLIMVPFASLALILVLPVRRG